MHLMNLKILCLSLLCKSNLRLVEHCLPFNLRWDIIVILFVVVLLTEFELSQHLVLRLSMNFDKKAETCFHGRGYDACVAIPQLLFLFLDILIKP